MESTSWNNRIQLSNTTAAELLKLKKGGWITPRDGTVTIMGKGEIQTYWLETRDETIKKTKMTRLGKLQSNQHLVSNGCLEEMTTLSDVSEGKDETDEETLELEEELSDDGRNHTKMTKTERLVEWNVEVMKKLLRQILAARHERDYVRLEAETDLAKIEMELCGGIDVTTTDVLGEFKEIITMPQVTLEDLKKRKNPKSIQLPPAAVDQLRQFLMMVASMYRPNAFHNFEHASHVTASVRKLLTRIVNADHGSQESSSVGTELVDLTGHSFGITSDPLTQFAVVFSAIIHDADHPGVPNVTLLKEDTRLAQIYKKSIAEQNSVDLVWALLFSPEYADLRSCIYSNEEELRRFRQLVVNTVMATDIADKELQALRKARWETAFSPTTADTTGNNDSSSIANLETNRKATIVIEHLIQASDVAHTMQHWHIYKQWNERFFFELYGTFKAGRSTMDPSIGWYKGEIGFFDFYIIPLAKKLASCGVFGVSSDEYLNYALANREEWVRKGEEIVKEYVVKFDTQHQDG